MKRKIRRFISVETEQISFLINRASADFEICDRCEKENVMLEPEKIAQVTKIKQREIYRLIETGDLHFIERDDEKIFVCLESLIKKEV